MSQSMESGEPIQYMYCATNKSTRNLQNHLEKIASRSEKPFILLDTEGHNLGSPNGRLSLLQLGLGTTTYIVDTLSYPAAIPTLKHYLETPHWRKYVWDGRSDYSELQHGHGITLKGVVDLQLVYVHLTTRSSRAPRLTGMLDASQQLEILPGKQLATIRLRTFQMFSEAGIT